MSTLGRKIQVMAVGSLLVGCAVGAAQGAPGAGARGQSRASSGTRLQSRDRLSTQSSDQLRDRTEDRLHDQDRLRARDRDQDRIYGTKLMSAAERTQYEERLHALATEQERVHFRMAHQHEMQERAERRGMKLGTAPSQAQIRSQEQQRQREREHIYGYSMMTPAEVGRYEQQMRNARTESARSRIMAEHRTAMQERARERGEAAPR